MVRESTPTRDEPTNPGIYQGEPERKLSSQKGQLPLIEEGNSSEPPNRVTAQPPPKPKSKQGFTRAPHREIARDVWILEGNFVNAFIVGTAPDRCVIVDTGMPGGGWLRSIEQAISELGRKPSAIVLTHGHVDHTGSARSLAEKYQIPIYAHERELPYLTGHSDYPPPDPTVGGFHANLSRFLSYTSQQLGERLKPLAAVAVTEGSIEELPGWRWFLTPGHAPGHVAFFRTDDRILIAGDAFETTNMDSWSNAVSKPVRFWRGGTPFTYDWEANKRSVETLAALEPTLVVASHGRPVTGSDVSDRLKEFAQNFRAPQRGRYVKSPAVVNERGVVSLPPKPLDSVPYIAAAIGIGMAYGVYRMYERRNHHQPTFST